MMNFIRFIFSMNLSDQSKTSQIEQIESINQKSQHKMQIIRSLARSIYFIIIFLILLFLNATTKSEQISCNFHQIVLREEISFRKPIL